MARARLTRIKGTPILDSGEHPRLELPGEHRRSVLRFAFILFVLSLLVALAISQYALRQVQSLSDASSESP